MKQPALQQMQYRFAVIYETPSMPVDKLASAYIPATKADARIKPWQAETEEKYLDLPVPSAVSQ